MIKQDKAAKAYDVIRSGGLTVIPSRVGYTMLGSSDSAMQKMFELKGRPLTKPAVVLTRFELINELAYVPPKHWELIENIHSEGLLCGFILPRKKHKFFSAQTEFANKNSQRDNGTSCFVIHGGEYIEYLVGRAIEDGVVVIGSSANKSGTGNEGMFSRIPAEILAGVDYAIEDDAYVHQEYDPASRAQGVMVDLNGGEAVIIREGLATEKIKAHVHAHNKKLQK
ncbi:MAG TPA: Sua5/YciO/YrdC/YwlC family protein [Patescibacteria group bacterium]|nr:Sua5/YciO/YrdC/YwlC family protein [Patescibacteria group bacterium]